MPIEFAMLKDKPPPFDECPNCHARPFDPFMRGMVQVFRWFGLRKRYCCVICYECKEIVGYEDPDGEATPRLVGLLDKAARLLPW